MTSGWFALALALLLTPAADPAPARLRALVEAQRLAPVRAGVTRPRRFRGIAPPGAIGIGLGGIAAVIVSTGTSPPLSLAAAVCAVTAWYLGVSALRARASRRAAAHLLAGLRVIEAELTAGSRPDAALRAGAAAASGHAEALAGAADEAARGGDVATFLAAAEPSRGGRGRDAGAARPGPLAALGHAWRLGMSVGAPLAEVVARVADDVAARARQERLVTSALASARSSAALLAVLPLLGVALGAAMDGDPLGFLFSSPGGRWVLLAGVTLDCAGLVWTHRLTARAERW